MRIQPCPERRDVSRLFDLKASGRLANFVLPYLDQDDLELKFAPPDLVPRASVAGYGTNFSAMPEEWIDRLSKRGEQLTLAVIKEHAPELMMARPDADAGGRADVHPSPAYPVNEKAYQ